MRFLCLSLAALLTLSACSTRTATDSDSTPSLVETEPREEVASTPPTPGDVSREAVTAHIDFSVPAELTITRPSEDITMSGENYYITGTSDPEAALLLNGEPVENRGKSGSFGVYVDLEPGVNTFTFSQGTVAKTAGITRDDSAYALTGSLSSLEPAYDEVVRAREEYILYCVGPSGAVVTAVIGGQTVELSQRAATAVEGIGASFLGYYTPENFSGTQEIGPITYTLNWKGTAEEFTSPGSLFIAGADDPILVEAVDVTASSFLEESDESGYFSTIQGGARDLIREIGKDMYQLDAGGWVYKTAVKPIPGAVDPAGSIEAADYKVCEDGLEQLTLTGLSTQPVRVIEEDGALALTLFHTTGMPELPLSGSRLFSDISAKEADGGTTLTFTVSEAPWGWLAEHKENEIVISFKPKPVPEAGGLPLSGITILLDPGHGGDDEGASGIARDKGPVEKDINLATAIAVQTYLEAGGATVLLSRETDERVNKNPRLTMIQQTGVDIMVSLHCNSIVYNYDGTGPSGTEVYYYHEGSKALAEALASGVSQATSRKNRGAKNANYWITLSPNAPSVLVEMGFLTNPAEYDQLWDKDMIYETAAAIEQGIVRILK